MNKAEQGRELFLEGLPPAIRSAQTLPLIQSRDGDAIPQITGPRGPLPLHSRYKAKKDWENLLSSPPGLDLIIGLGNGLGLIERLSISPEIWVVAYEESEDLRQSLEIPGVLGALGHSKVRLLILGPKDELGDHLAQDYHPRLQGPLNICANPVLLRQYPETYSRWTKEALSQDLLWKRQGKTYRFFGGRWARNMLRNLETGIYTSTVTPRLQRVLITAAGPSLAEQWQDFEHRQDDLILATDTSLPWLKSQGIKPWAVLSIDAQYHTLRHYPTIKPEDLGSGGLLMDLSSPPALRRRYPAGKILYSGHPFCLWLEHKGLRRPRLQMGLGNVTAVAVDFAKRFRAQEIVVLGADFSYPQRNAYLKETFIHRLWATEQDRLTPLHSLNYRLSAERQGGMQGGNWHSPVMDQYKADLLAYCEAWGKASWDQGILYFSPKKGGNPPAEADGSIKPPVLAKEYRQLVAALPPWRKEKEGFWIYRKSLPVESSWVLSTLFPLISSAPEMLRQEEIFTWIKDWIGRY
jgi:hypothetical protein